jgi:serine/threonine protein phosphatase 1
MRCFVIGDIHGCLNELRYLIEGLPLARRDRLIFLGDYVDRGPDSNGVVSYLIELQKNSPYDFVFLKGNHEDMFLSYLGLPGQHGDMFLVNGGKVTLESYGLSTNRDPKELLAQIPSQHVDFYQNLINYYIAEPFLCVHAGVHPLKSLEEQTESEMFWIRNQFIYRSHMLPYVILFGHTPQSDVFYDLPYKIGLDTGLVYGNKLTCLEIEQKVLYQIHRGKKQIKKIPIQKKWDAMSTAITP